MEGPYRDLGAGFARLTGVEGARRGPSRVLSVEDALLELARNAHDAGARGVYVASTLRRRRFRVLTVIDDGWGIPWTHKALIFEPGVTTRHLDPVLDNGSLEVAPQTGPHGAGLSLYHLKNAALSAEVLSPSSPTAIKAVFDTRTLPERALQSGSRPSKTNLKATLASLLADPASPNAYYGPPARILATLLHHHIIQEIGGPPRVRERAAELGLELSLRTVRRVVGGEIRPVDSVVAPGIPGALAVPGADPGVPGAPEGPVLRLGEEERRGIADILGRAAKNSYLEVDHVEVGSRPGEVRIRARVYEPEEEYE